MKTYIGTEFFAQKHCHAASNCQVWILELLLTGELEALFPPAVLLQRDAKPHYWILVLELILRNNSEAVQGRYYQVGVSTTQALHLVKGSVLQEKDEKAMQANSSTTKYSWYFPGVKILLSQLAQEVKQRDVCISSVTSLSPIDFCPQRVASGQNGYFFCLGVLDSLYIKLSIGATLHTFSPREGCAGRWAEWRQATRAHLSLQPSVRIHL